MTRNNKTQLAALVTTLLAGTAYGGGWTLFDEQDSSTVAVLNSCNAQGVCTTPLNFNGDVNPSTGQPVVDLAIANDYAPIRIYVGAGEVDRGFSAMGTVGAYTMRSSGLRFADLDNDGDIDMIQTTRGSGNFVYRFRNESFPYYCGGDPCEGEPDVQLGVNDESQGLAVGDIDLDCKIDVFIANGLGAPNKVYLNTTGGIPPPSGGTCAPIAENFSPLTFGAAISLTSTGVGGADSDSRKAELVDVDGDGDLDAIVANADGNDNWLYINQTRPAVVPPAPPLPLFAAPVPLTATTADDAEITLAVAVADIDGDGDSDIAVANSNNRNRYYFNLGGTATPAARFGTTGTFGSADDVSNDVKLGDVNRDGFLDAVVTNDPGPSRVHLLGGAAGSVADYAIALPTGLPTVPLTVDDARGLDLGKLDNDGWLDLVIANTNGQYNLRFLNNSLCYDDGAPLACDPFANVLPTVTGQTGPALVTNEDVATSIPRLLALAGVTATDGDNLSGDLRVVVEPGNNYTITTATASATNILPAVNFAGTLGVNARVTDLTGVSLPFTFNVTVTPVADPPSFTSTAVTTASQGAAYSYAITTADPDVGEARTISALTKPTWLSLVDAGNGTATLSGTPGAADIGTHDVVLEVRDSASPPVSQTFTVTVANANDAPEFSSTGLTAATAGTEYSYAITTTDPDAGDTRTIAGTVPSWLTLTDAGNGTATLRGTPAAANVGAHNISLTVTDAGGATATQTFTVTVAAAGTPPPANNPPPSSGGGGGGGGGGSTGALEVLALLTALGAVLRRRRSA